MLHCAETISMTSSIKWLWLDFLHITADYKKKLRGKVQVTWYIVENRRTDATFKFHHAVFSISWFQPARRYMWLSRAPHSQKPFCTVFACCPCLRVCSPTSWWHGSSPPPSVQTRPPHGCQCHRTACPSASADPWHSAGSLCAYSCRSQWGTEFNQHTEFRWINGI